MTASPLPSYFFFLFSPKRPKGLQWSLLRSAILSSNSMPSLHGNGVLHETINFVEETCQCAEAWLTWVMVFVHGAAWKRYRPFVGHPRGRVLLVACKPCIKSNFFLYSLGYRGVGPVWTLAFGLKNKNTIIENKYKYKYKQTKIKINIKYDMIYKYEVKNRRNLISTKIN